MLTKVAVSESLTKADASYLARLDELLREISTIHQEIAWKRTEGRKVAVSLDRKLKEIQAAITRVVVTL